MDYYKLTLKILRYLVQAIILFILLKYLPLLELSTNNALLITLLILLITVIIETVCVLYKSNEKFSECNSCKVENFDSTSKCKLVRVCDDDKKESFTSDLDHDGNRNIFGIDKHGNEVRSTAPVKQVYDGTLHTNSQYNVKTKHIQNYDASDPIETDIKHKINVGYKPDPCLKTHGMPDILDFPVAHKSEWTDEKGTQGYDNRQGHGSMFYDQYPYYNKYQQSEKGDSIKNTGDYLGGKANHPYGDDGMATYAQLKQKIEENAHDIGGYENPYQGVSHKSQVLVTTSNQRRIEGPLDDELPYTDYNHLPVASGYKSHAYEYGYSYLPPEKWYPLPPRPPICVTEKRDPVCPLYADGTADLKEFHTASRITQPYRLSRHYVVDKMNSGR